jgi:hypothetical protein
LRGADGARTAINTNKTVGDDGDDGDGNRQT